MRKFVSVFLVLILIFALAISLVACMEPVEPEYKPPIGGDGWKPTDENSGISAAKVFDILAAATANDNNTVNMDFSLPVRVDGKEYDVTLQSNIPALNSEIHSELCLKVTDKESGAEQFAAYLVKSKLYLSVGGVNFFIEDFTGFDELIEFLRGLPEFKEILNDLLSMVGGLIGGLDLNWGLVETMVYPMIFGDPKLVEKGNVTEITMPVKLHEFLSVTVPGLLGLVNLDDLLANAGVQLNGSLSGFINEVLSSIPYFDITLSSRIVDNKCEYIDISIVDTEEVFGLAFSGSYSEDTIDIVFPEDFAEYQPFSLTNFDFSVTLDSNTSESPLDVGAFVNMIVPGTLPEGVITLSTDLAYTLRVRGDLDLKDNDKNMLAAELYYGNSAVAVDANYMAGVYIKGSVLYVVLDELLKEQIGADENGVVNGIKIQNIQVPGVNLTGVFGAVGDLIARVIEQNIGGIFPQGADDIVETSAASNQSNQIFSTTLTEKGLAISPDISAFVKSLVSLFGFGEFIELTENGEFKITVNGAFMDALTDLVPSIALPEGFPDEFGEAVLTVELASYGIDNINIEYKYNDGKLLGLKAHSFNFGIADAELKNDIDKIVTEKEFTGELLDIIRSLLDGIDIAGSGSLNLAQGNYDIIGIIESLNIPGVPDLPSITLNVKEPTAVKLDVRVQADFDIVDGFVYDERGNQLYYAHDNDGNRINMHYKHDAEGNRIPIMVEDEEGNLVQAVKDGIPQYELIAEDELGETDAKDPYKVYGQQIYKTTITSKFDPVLDAEVGGEFLLSVDVAERFLMLNKGNLLTIHGDGNDVLIKIGSCITNVNIPAVHIKYDLMDILSNYIDIVRFNLADLLGGVFDDIIDKINAVSPNPAPDDGEGGEPGGESELTPAAAMRAADKDNGNIALEINGDAVKFYASAAAISALLQQFGVSFELPDFDISAEVGAINDIKLSVAGVFDLLGLDISINKINIGNGVDITLSEDVELQDPIGNVKDIVADVLSNLQVAADVDLNLAPGIYDISDVLGGLLSELAGFDLPSIRMDFSSGIDIQARAVIELSYDIDNPSASELRIELFAKEDFKPASIKKGLILGIYLSNDNIYLDASNVRLVNATIPKICVEGLKLQDDLDGNPIEPIGITEYLKMILDKIAIDLEFAIGGLISPIGAVSERISPYELLTEDDAVAGAPNAAFGGLGLILGKDQLTLYATGLAVQELLDTFNISVPLPEFDLNLGILDYSKLYLNIAMPMRNYADADGVTYNDLTLDAKVTDIVIGRNNIMLVEETGAPQEDWAERMNVTPYEVQLPAFEGYNSDIKEIVKALISDVQITAALNYDTSRTTLDLTSLINNFLATADLQLPFPINLKLDDMENELVLGIEWHLDFNNHAKTFADISIKSASGGFDMSFKYQDRTLFVDFSCLGLMKFYIEDFNLTPLIDSAIDDLLVQLGVTETDLGKLLNTLLSSLTMAEGKTSPYALMAEQTYGDMVASDVAATADDDFTTNIINILLSNLSIKDSEIVMNIAAELVSDLLLQFGYSIGMDISTELGVDIMAGRLRLDAMLDGIDAGITLQVDRVGRYDPATDGTDAGISGQEKLSYTEYSLTSTIDLISSIFNNTSSMSDTSQPYELLAWIDLWKNTPSNGTGDGESFNSTLQLAVSRIHKSIELPNTKGFGRVTAGDILISIVPNWGRNPINMASLHVIIKPNLDVKIQATYQLFPTDINLPGIATISAPDLIKIDIGNLNSMIGLSSLLDPILGELPVGKSDLSTTAAESKAGEEAGLDVMSLIGAINVSASQSGTTHINVDINGKSLSDMIIDLLKYTIPDVLSPNGAYEELRPGDYSPDSTDFVEKLVKQALHMLGYGWAAGLAWNIVGEEVSWTLGALLPLPEMDKISLDVVISDSHIKTIKLETMKNGYDGDDDSNFIKHWLEYDQSRNQKNRKNSLRADINLVTGNGFADWGDMPGLIDYEPYGNTYNGGITAGLEDKKVYVSYYYCNQYNFPLTVDYSTNTYTQGGVTYTNSYAEMKEADAKWRNGDKTAYNALLEKQENGDGLYIIAHANHTGLGKHYYNLIKVRVKPPAETLTARDIYLDAYATLPDEIALEDETGRVRRVGGGLKYYKSATGSDMIELDYNGGTYNAFVEAAHYDARIPVTIHLANGNLQSDDIVYQNEFDLDIMDIGEDGKYSLPKYLQAQFPAYAADGSVKGRYWKAIAVNWEAGLADKITNAILASTDGNTQDINTRVIIDDNYVSENQTLDFSFHIKDSRISEVKFRGGYHADEFRIDPIEYTLGGTLDYPDTATVVFSDGHTREDAPIYWAGARDSAGNEIAHYLASANGGKADVDTVFETREFTRYYDGATAADFAVQLKYYRFDSATGAMTEEYVSHKVKAYVEESRIAYVSYGGTERELDIDPYEYMKYGEELLPDTVTAHFESGKTFNLPVTDWGITDDIVNPTTAGRRNISIDIAISTGEEAYTWNIGTYLNVKRMDVVEPMLDKSSDGIYVYNLGEQAVIDYLYGGKSINEIMPETLPFKLRNSDNTYYTEEVTVSIDTQYIELSETGGTWRRKVAIGSGAYFRQFEVYLVAPDVSSIEIEAKSLSDFVTIEGDTITVNQTFFDRYNQAVITNYVNIRFAVGNATGVRIDYKVDFSNFNVEGEQRTVTFYITDAQGEGRREFTFNVNVVKAAE